MDPESPRGSLNHHLPEERLDALTGTARRRRSAGPQARVLVGAGDCGYAVGAADLIEALRDAARETSIPVVAAGCTGRCHAAVEVTIQRPGVADWTWSNVTPAQATALIAIAAGERAPSAAPGGFAWEDGGLPPFLAGQRRALLASTGRCDPVSLDEALLRGRYRGLARALGSTPEAVIADITRANLAGRGGAYFPAAIKWEGARTGGAAPRYLVVNAEEGEPGVFKDRHLLEGDPHLAIEGMLVAAYAIGAARIIVFLNGLASLARERLDAALDQARERGLIGEQVLGSEFSCEVEVRRGAGGYVLGEESAMLESIEGRRPMPRVRPPFPTVSGLWGRPTVINNVETLACAALVLEHSPDWFVTLGTSRWPGTKLICVSGDVARPGLVEVEIGTPLREVIDGMAGGVAGGQTLQAVLTGGPSGVLAPPSLLDTPLEPRRDDLLLGSGNVVVFDDTQSLFGIVRRLTRFNAEESCGKCTPCREGVNRMREILDRVDRGETRAGDRRDLLDLGEVAASASICGLGQMAPNPILSALRHFALPELDGQGEEVADGAYRHR
jgi:NADH:ubiquinone oxidoreductase subunit F (NADH-binding)